MRLLVGSGYIEPGMCLAFIGGAAFAVRYLRRGGRGHLALAAAGLGLSIGFKVTMAPMALILLGACAVRALARRRPGDVAVAALLFAVLASPWYVYNVIDSGRPLTPFSTVIAGFDLGNPTPGVRKAFEELARNFPPYVWPREWEAFQRTFLFTARQPETLGYASAVPFVVFLVTWPFWLRRRWTVALPLVLVVAANLAYLYGREAAPLRMLWPESVSRFWLPAFAVAIPASALWCGRFPRAARAYLAVLLLIAFYNALRYLHLHHAAYDIDAQLRLGLALLGAGLLVRLVPRRGRLAAGAALAVVVLAGLDRHVIAHRWEAFGHSMVIHYTPTVWVPLGRAVDHPGTPHRIAVTGGSMSGSESWFGYGLLGSRLQNDIFYVPITRDGRIVDEFARLKEVGDAAAWIRRIGERGVDYVVSMQPATIEISWMLTNRHLFEPVFTERQGRDPGRGVWRVRRDRFASVP
jgi:hypothetical protein